MNEDTYAPRRAMAWPHLDDRQRAGIEAARRRDRTNAAGLCCCDSGYLCNLHRDQRWRDEAAKLKARHDACTNGEPEQ